MFDNSPAKPPKNKPWAILEVSRRQYEAARPWKNAKLTRREFEDLLAILPDGFVEHVHLEADAERLIAAAFGNGG